MKKVFSVIVAMLVVASFFPISAYAESSVNLPGMMGVVAGGGVGGQGTDEVNDYQFIYLGAYFNPMINETVGIRGTMMYFGNFEEGEEWFSSSTSGLSTAVETYRAVLGFTLQGEQNGWWAWNYLAAGVDYQIGEGFLPVTVLQEELMFGSGWFYNFLCFSARIGDEDYESYYLRDQAYARLTNWLAIGPQVQYVWFYQPDPDNPTENQMVYEPAWGGQVRFTENAEDPRYSLTIGGTNGDYVGTTWHADVWIRF